MGRPAERLTIQQAVEAVGSGGFRAVTLEGEPGIGKTRLLEAGAGMAEERGFTVLTAISDEELQGPLLVARSLFTSATAREAAAAAGQEAALDRLVHGLSGRPDPGLGGLSPDQQLIHLYDLAAVMLREMSGHVPVAILLDDVQWADQDSMRLLRYLVRSEVRSRIFLLLAFRAEEAAATEVATLVADMERVRVARRLRLGRFSAVETGELLRPLLGADVAPSTVAALHAQSEGVPFMLEELALGYRDAGLLQQIRDTWQLTPKAERLLPPSVEMLIRRRTGRLPEATRTVMAEAAVIGRTFSLRDVAAVRERLGDPGTDLHELAEAMAPAVEVGLVTELPEGWNADFRFTHEQIRTFAAGSIPRPRRRAIHAAIVELLMAGGQPAPEALGMLAQHSLAAGMADRCARFSVEAARRALESRAPEEVLRLVDAALSAAANPSDRVELLRQRDEALAMLRRTAERLEGLPQLAALARALEDPSLEVDVMLRRAAALRAAEDMERAGELAAQARDLARDRGDTASELRALFEMGQAALGATVGEAFVPPAVGVDLEGAKAAYTDALHLAEELGDRPRIAAALRETGVATLGQVRIIAKEWFTHPDRGMPWEHPPLLEGLQTVLGLYQRALEIFQELGDRQGTMSTLIAMAYAGWGLNIRFGSAKRMEDLRRLISRIHTLTKEGDEERQQAHMLYGVHLYGRAFGFPDLALPRGREAFEAARRIGDRRLELVVAGSMALAHCSMGEVDEAGEWVERAAAAAAAAPTPVRARQLATWQGTVAAAAGDGVAMRHHLERALTLAIEDGRPAARCEALARLSLEAALLGVSTDDRSLLDVAARHAPEARGLGESLRGDHPWTAQALAAEALVARSQERHEDAAEAAGSALEALDGLGILDAEPPYHLHTDVVVAAMRILGHGRGERADRARERTRAILHTVGQRIVDEEVRVRWFRGPHQRELAELAGGVEPPLSAEEIHNPLWVEVSDRERDLLEMVILGKTNREIADELNRAEEQVATELGAIYAKLGVSTRAGAVAMALAGGVT